MSELHFDTFEQLVKGMNQITDDPLYETGHNMVIYRGNPDADLMVIGEAPGANEDRLLKPYVGRSGKLLDEILQTAGFDSEDGVFVTNTTFRRPPENRNPTKAEMAFFRPYLMEIIRLVNPKVIVLTGKFSMLQLIGEKKGITKVRGNWYEVDGRLAMPVFHPAYLLYNSSKEEGKPKWLMSQDMQTIRAKYDELGGRQDLLAKEQSS